MMKNKMTRWMVALVAAMLMLGRGKGPEGPTVEGARLEAAGGAPPLEPPRGPMM